MVDFVERERLRQTLAAYKLREKLGAPSLARRIHERHPKRITISTKTVQRFLGSVGRINDLTIQWFGEFLEREKFSLPEDPRLALGQSLYAAMGTEPITEKMDLWLLGSSASNRAIIEPCHPFGLLTETADGLIYDGVIVGAGAFHVQSWDRLFKLPKSYTFAAGKGHGHLLTVKEQTRVFEIDPLPYSYQDPVPRWRNNMDKDTRSPVAFARAPEGIYGASAAITSIMENSPDDINRTCRGIPLLHIAIALNNLHLARELVRFGATVGPDCYGRLPSDIAAQCLANPSEEMMDFVAEIEETANL